MVPDLPSPSRRAILAGAGVTLAGATVGVGAVAPTALPDSVTDRASKWLPDPTDHRWHPPVSEAHARDAVGRLAAEVERDPSLGVATRTGTCSMILSEVLSQPLKICSY